MLWDLSWVEICEQEVLLLPPQAQGELRAQWPGRAREPLLVVIRYVPEPQVLWGESAE